VSARLVRLLFALVGALAVTIGILLSMNEVAERVRQRDPTKYFRISDVIVLPGSKRPERPPTPDLPPQRAQPDVRLGGTPDFGVSIPSAPRDENRSVDIPPVTLPPESPQ
jgi:hypothetical protein